MISPDLFIRTGDREALSARATVLRGYAIAGTDALMTAICDVQTRAPFGHMITPGGFEMSVAMTNCGRLGWISDRRGYRYSEIDPRTGKPWPSMPSVLSNLAHSAAAAAGFADFEPDACLINRYVPGSRLTLHQDKNELDFRAPIVSVSLGIPAIFLFGGHARTERALRVPIFHGDVVVWGGEDRLRYHGVSTIKEDVHPTLGRHRINLTFRKAG